jgi:predicted secreted protein
VRRIVLCALAALVLTAAVASADKTVGRKASGSTIHLKVGEKLTVRLKECRPCGYMWHTLHAPKKAVLKQSKSSYLPPKQPAGTVGGAGTRVITYVARGAGTTSLKLGYRAPSGTDDGTFTLKIVVG